VFKAVFTSNDDEFWREAKLLSELDHPNVVKLFGVVEMKVRNKYGGKGHTKELLMVMEYVKRGSIADAAKSGSYVPRQHWHRHAVELATTVAWLHDQGVVHRDLKPSNVLLGDDGSIKICDLGVSRRQSEGGAAATVQDMMTMTVGVGTFPFMPPEVMRDAARQHDEEEGGAAFGDRHRYDGRAVDVYSLAITLIQMWTCKQLYPGAGAVDVSVGAVCCLHFTYINFPLANIPPSYSPPPHSSSATSQKAAAHCCRATSRTCSSIFSCACTAVNHPSVSPQQRFATCLPAMPLSGRSTKSTLLSTAKTNRLVIL
jgi:serine/threonine protein kinase